MTLQLLLLGLTSEVSEVRNRVQVTLGLLSGKKKKKQKNLCAVLLAEKMLKSHRKELKDVFFLIGNPDVSYFVQSFPKSKERKAKPKNKTFQARKRQAEGEDSYYERQLG